MPFNQEELKAIARKFTSGLYWIYQQATDEIGQDHRAWWVKT